MNTAIMPDPIAETSPRFKARIAGVFWLLTILTGALAAFFGHRLGVYGPTVNLIADACYVVVTLVLYGIFKPVNRSLSFLAALFGLAGCALGALMIFRLASSPINPLVFFGFHCLLVGYLIFRSTFLPRALGALMVFGGLGWLTFLSPAVARSLSPYILFPGILGEGSLTLWLLVIGLDVQRWREQARAAEESLVRRAMEKRQR